MMDFVESGHMCDWSTSCNLSWGPLHFKELCKEKKIRDYYGSGWVVGPGLIRNSFCGKSSQNSPKPVLIFWSSIPCVFCLYPLLKVVGYYDLSVLSMSVNAFLKKNMVGGVSSIQIFVGFLEFFNFAKPLSSAFVASTSWCIVSGFAPLCCITI